MSFANFLEMYKSLDGVEMTQDLYLTYLEVKNLIATSLGFTDDLEIAYALVAMSSILAKEVADRPEYNNG